MRKSIFFILFLFSVSLHLKAQTNLILQDFSSASGTTPPADWTVQTITGEPAVDVWHFDNPGRRTPGAPIAGNFACFDSDKLSNNSQAEEVYLTSPIFDGTTTDNIILEFDQYFLSGYGSACSVEVYNGASWVSIYSNASTTNNPHHSTFDITTHVQNKTNAQIRFKWSGNYSWFWIIDNVKIFIQPPIIVQFTEQTGISLSGVQQGSVSWGDYDNDGDLDILLTGSTGSAYISKIYRNNGDNSFAEQTGIALTGVYNSSAAWGDYDNDGDLDILLTGDTGSGYISKIYRNNGNNTFTEQTAISLTGVYLSSVAWGDYDNNGYLDILLTGYTSSSSTISKIYKNTGSGFTEQTGILLIGVCAGSVAWGDYDNDGNLDILLTGNNNSTTISKIYHNNGDNTFTEQTGIPLTGVYASSVAWGDYNNDGYLDILLTGETVFNNPNSAVSKIYKNNGNNTFTEQTGISLAGVCGSSVAWGDYDNDGDLDIILTGYSITSSIISKIYKNTGIGFEDQTTISLLGTGSSSLVWGDYDNDGDLDIILTGSSSSGKISKIYKNNNTLKNTVPTIPSNLNAIVTNQQFQLTWDKSTDTQTPQDGLSYNLYIGSSPGNCNIITPMSNAANGFRKIGKIGNIGQKNSCAFSTSLPAGNYYWGIQAIDQTFAGSGFATSTITISDAQASNIQFTDITNVSMNISWIRGNKQKCAVFIKEGNSGLPTLVNNTYYTANNQFALGAQAGAGWYCVYNGTGVNTQVTGLNSNSIYTIMVIEYSGGVGAETYLTCSNTSNPKICSTVEQFTNQTAISLTGVAYTSVVWGDYDNDGDLDILLTGNSSSINISKIYRNNGDNSFTEQTTISLTGVRNGSAAWGDYDNDGDLDILLTGTTNGNTTGAISKIYRNNYPTNSFTDAGITLAGVINGSVAWGDYDNDGDLDILLTGESSSGNISKIYRNNGSNSFTESGIALTGVQQSSVAWGDYDNDGYLDILLTGLNSSWSPVSKIYRNNGNGSFTEQSSIYGVGLGSAVWGDYDNDGDLDILLTGSNNGNNTGATTKIYRNNYPENSFTELTAISLINVAYSSVAWGDYDNDGDLDILLTGINGSDGVSKIYKNNGNSTFSEQNTISLTGVYNSSVAWGDYDNDGDLDFVLTGNPSNISKIYKNNNSAKNTRPTVPSSIICSKENKKLTLIWDKATDIETPQLGLCYNLRIGTTPGGSEIMAPMALSTGVRTIATKGNMQHNNSCVIDLTLRYEPLPTTIYYSVQAIDNGYLASEWTPEKTEISKFVVEFLPNTACQKSDVEFLDKSYSIDYPITSWQWEFIEGGITKATSSLEKPTYSFQTYGTNQVKLTLTNSNNETLSRTKFITVLPSPLVDFTALPVCQNTLTTITNTTNSNTTNITNWLWEFGDGTSNSVLEHPINHSYNPGINHLTLTAFADNGCQLTTIKEVLVAELPSTLLSITGNSIYCTNENTSLSADKKTYYTYQWKSNGAIMTDSTKFKLFPKASSSYSVAITNTLANSCTSQSDPIVLTVKPSPPKLNITDPTGTVFCLNDIAAELSAPLVSGLTYNWMVNSSLAMSGSNTHLPQQSGNYSLIVTNSDNCSQAANNTITGIVINPLPPVPNVTSPTPTFCSGVPFTMETPNSGELTYQWLNNGNTILGATQNTFSPTLSGLYAVKVTKNGCSNTSVSSNVTVLDSPSTPAIVFSGETSFCQGSTLLLEAVEVTGVTRQWKRDGGLVGSGLSYTVTQTGKYSLTVVKSSTGCSANSADSVNVTVKTSPAIPVISVTGYTTFCSGDSVKLDIASQSGVTYQWKRDGGIVGSNTNQLYAKAAGSYSISLSNSNGCGVNSSNTVAVTVNERPLVPIISTSGPITFCSGDSVLLSITSQSGVTYQWKLNGYGIGQNFNTLYAKTSGNYTISLINPNSCSSLSTNSVTVTAKEKPTLPTVNLSGSTQFCDGGSVQLSVTNNPALSYQWKNGAAIIIGFTSNTYNATTSGNYSLLISNDQECSVETGLTNVTVLDSPLTPAIIFSGETSFCQGSTLLLEAVEVTGVTRQWKRDGGLVGSGLSYTVTQTGKYSLTVVNSSTGCSANSADSVNVTMKTSPAMPVISVTGYTTFCSGDSVKLDIASQSGVTYQWKRDGGIVGSNTNQLYAKAAGSYSISLSNSNGCGVNSSNTVAVTVNERPLVPIISTSGPITFCSGDSVLLSITSQSGVAYQWKLNGYGIGQNYNTLYAKTSGNYTISLINSNSCSSLSTNSVTVTAKEKPTLPTVNLSGPTQFCEGGSVQLSVTNNPALSYQWKNGNDIITGATGNLYTATTTGSYQLEIINAQGCNVITLPVSVIVNPMPAKPTIAEANNNTLFCLGTQVELKVTNASPNLTYQWKRSGIAIDGATQANYKGQLTSGDYTLETKLGSCASESSTLTLTTKTAPAKPKIYARGPNVWILSCDNTAASDYRWYYNNQLIPGAKSYMYCANQTLGNYYVEISDGGECYTMSDIINIPTGNIVSGITELLSDHITVYPNPTEGWFTVILGTTLPGELKVELGDALGKTVAHYQFQNSNSFTIDLSRASKGIYFCKMYYQNSIVVKKIVKQ